MLVRVCQFIFSRIAAFPVGLPGHDLYLTIGASVKNMEKHSTSQASHKHGARGKTAEKNLTGMDRMHRIEEIQI